MPHNVRDLLKGEFGDALATNQQQTDYSVTVNAMRTLTHNTKRIQLILSNLGPSFVAVGFDATVTLTKGIPLTVGSTIEFDWDEDPENVTREIWMVQRLGPTLVHAVETLLTGEPSESN